MTSSKFVYATGHVDNYEQEKFSVDRFFSQKQGRRRMQKKFDKPELVSDYREPKKISASADS